MAEQKDPRAWVEGMSLDAALADPPGETGKPVARLDVRTIAIVVGVALLAGVAGGLLATRGSNEPNDVQQQLDELRRSVDDVRDYVDDRPRR